MTNTIYHGTCRAFVELARERNGSFGPDYDEVYFTDNLDEAREYATSWNTSRGRVRLNELFNGNLPIQMCEPIILEFDRTRINNLSSRSGLYGNREFYVPRGPIHIVLQGGELI